MFAISCRGSAMILPGLAIAVANLCKTLSRIYAKPFWTAVHNLCIDPTASGVEIASLGRRGAHGISPCLTKAVPRLASEAAYEFQQFERLQIVSKDRTIYQAYRRCQFPVLRWELSLQDLGWRLQRYPAIQPPVGSLGRPYRPPPYQEELKRKLLYNTACDHSACEHLVNVVGH